MELQRSWLARRILKNNKAGGITLPDFEPDYRNILIKTVVQAQKEKHIGQRNRNRETGTKPTHVWLNNL